MIAVLLTILKIIGIILLAAIALALLLVLIVLFVPIRYRIRAAKSDTGSDLSLRIGVTFLLHLLSGGFVYDNSGSDRFARILGIKIWPGKDKDTEEEAGHEEGSDTAEELTPQAAHEETLPEYESMYTVDMNDPVADDDAPGPDLTGFGQEAPDEEKSLADKICDIIEMLSSKYHRIEGRIDNIRRDIRYWDKMINDTRNRNAVAFARDILVKFLKKTAPRSVKGFIHFGFDDPATTGKVLSYLALVYPVLPRKLVIDPSFEDTLVYGNADIKGRLALITVGVALLRLYFNKDCKRLYRLYKRHKSDKE